jgi:hypothetical protein
MLIKQPSFDGSIYTPLNTDDAKATKNVAYIEIAFDIRDLPLIKKYNLF